jgi:diguanylate cyclase (GGDEF)-like protein
MNIDPRYAKTLAAQGSLAGDSYDPITGLPNRQQMLRRLAEAVVRARRQDEPLAVLLVDVDAFRIVNAAVGQSAGDALLIAVAERLMACAGSHLVARTGDNEFTILAAGVPPESIVDVAADVLASFHEPFDIGGQDIHVTASVGISDLARDGEGADFLLRAAAAALHRAKELGGNQRQYSSSTLTLAEFERLHVEHRVRQAIASGEFSLVYQPQVRFHDCALVGLEALLRWNRNGQTIPASAFIRAIEHSPVIIDLGEWVIGETCRQIAEWRRTGVDAPRVAVNVGARHFQQPYLAEAMQGQLEKNGLEGAALELEITETAAMQDATAAARTIDALRALGLEITIDDFGTGYSSLAYLTRFAITGLKIDRAFVADVPDSRSATAIVNAIVATAHALDLRVVAEGVETREQAEFLAASNCDMGQGYLFAYPIAAQEIPAYLKTRKETI